MINDKKIMEIFSNDIKNNQKSLFKGNKNKFNLKKNKEPELMLSRIEEIIELGKFKDRFIDTCFLKDLNKLFVNNNETKNNFNNNLIGFTFDTGNQTIFKFNKTPNKLEIERFVLPDKKIKKSYNKIKEYQNESNDDKENLNNISENKGHLNFLRKFKENYQSELEEMKKKKKNVNSNIITNSNRLKKTLKDQKNINTIFFKMNVKDILNDSKSQKKKKRSIVNSKEIKNKEFVKDEIIKEKKKLKEKDNYKEDYNFNSVTKWNRKNKTKKQDMGFQFNNKQKNFLKKRSENYSELKNIRKMTIDKREYNDNEDEKGKHSIILDNVKRNKKSFHRNNVKMKASTKTCYFNLDRTPKKNNKKKYLKFRSEIHSKNNNNNIFFRNKLLNNKHSENNLIVKKKLLCDNILNNENLYSENSKNKISDYLSDSSTKKNNKEQKDTNANNMEILKFESEKFLNLNKDNITNNSLNSNHNNEEENKLENNNNLKIVNDNNQDNKLCIKVKHKNNLYMGKNIINNDEYNNNVIKISSYSVVKPDNLISLEYNKNNDSNNDNNKNNTNSQINNQNKLIIKSAENMNETDNGEYLNKKGEKNNLDKQSDNVIKYINKDKNISNNENDNNNSLVKRKCNNFFCCL